MQKVSSNPMRSYSQFLTRDNMAQQIATEVITMLTKSLPLAQSEQRSQPESIHTLRVTFKRLRAYWQLMQFTVNRADFKNHTQRIRRSAKQLAGARDQQVLCDSLNNLKNRLKLTDKIVVDPLIKQLQPTCANSALQQTISWPLVISALHLELSTWHALQAQSIAARNIQKGFKKTNKQTAKWATKASAKTGDITQRHQWRKWVKYQFFQIKLLKNIGLKGHKKTLQTLKKLGEALGQEHDFEILQHYLIQQVRQQSSSQKVPFKKLIKANRQQLKQIRKEVEQLNKVLIKSHY